MSVELQPWIKGIFCLNCQLYAFSCRTIVFASSQMFLSML